MTEWFASYNGLEQLFLLSGIVGGIILVSDSFSPSRGSTITAAWTRRTLTVTPVSRR